MIPYSLVITSIKYGLQSFLEKTLSRNGHFSVTRFLQGHFHEKTFPRHTFPGT